jgi:hypothetical protein
MGSSSKRRMTIAKRDRERTLKERRAQKQQKKDEKKQAAAVARSANVDSTVSTHGVNDETDSG